MDAVRLGSGRSSRCACHWQSPVSPGGEEEVSVTELRLPIPGEQGPGQGPRGLAGAGSWGLRALV